jgi:hypothetical protein
MEEFIKFIEVVKGFSDIGILIICGTFVYYFKSKKKDEQALLLEIQMLKTAMLEVSKSVNNKRPEEPTIKQNVDMLCKDLRCATDTLNKLETLVAVLRSEALFRNENFEARVVKIEDIVFKSFK